VIGIPRLTAAIGMPKLTAAIGIPRLTRSGRTPRPAPPGFDRGLIAARVLLGFGTSAAYPASMRLTRSEAERTGQDSPARVPAALAVANQTVAVVGPARIASAAGLLRTFMYLGALGASAANAAFFAHGADTAGLHDLALFMLTGAVLLLAVALLDRSLPSLNSASGKA